MQDGGGAVLKSAFAGGAAEQRTGMELVGHHLGLDLGQRDLADQTVRQILGHAFRVHRGEGKVWVANHQGFLPVQLDGDVWL